MSVSEESKQSQPSSPESNGSNTSFGGVQFNPDGSLHLSILNGSLLTKEVPPEEAKQEAGEIIRHFREKSGWKLNRNGQLVPTDVASAKIDAALRSRMLGVGIAGAGGQKDTLRSEFWMGADAVGYPVREKKALSSSAELALHASKHFSEEGFPKIHINQKTREVFPTSLIPLELYTETDRKDVEMARYYANKLKGEKIVEVSSTAAGGGVAKMMHRKIDILRKLGVDVHWYLMTDDDESVFEVTKGDIHNVLQNRAESGRVLAGESERKFDSWSGENADRLEPFLEQATIVIDHDPQPSRTVFRTLDKLNKKFTETGVGKKIKSIYRSHIQKNAERIDTPGTPQNITWQALWKDGIEHADLFITHPLPEFVPGNVPRDKVVAMGATTDRFDGLNKPLTPEQLIQYKGEINNLLAHEEWIDGKKGQKPIDWDRQYGLQIARWDPSKGIDLLLEHYRQYREDEKRKGTDPKDTAQLVLAGMGATDDPDQRRVFNQALEILQSEQFRDIADDVKILRVPPKDQLLNALMKESTVYFQNSTAEGFEVLATEALLAGKPQIASKEGGIKLQLTPAEDLEHVGQEHDSFLIDPYDHKGAAQYMSALFNPENKSLYDSMAKAAKEHGRKSKYTTMQNVVNWLYLMSKLKTGEHIDGNLADVHDMAEAEYDRRQKDFTTAA